MKLMMVGLDHHRSTLSVREKFAVTKEGTLKILTDFKGHGGVGGCVILSTCNRMEAYVSIPNDAILKLSETLCAILGIDFSAYGHHLTERVGEDVFSHLCRVASGLESQVIGDGQIITQIREALELSRGNGCTDSYIETMFNLSIHAAKVIKTKVFADYLRTSGVPEKAVEGIKAICGGGLAGMAALVIGSGVVGRRVAELMIREGARVTVTLRSRKSGVIQIPNGAGAVSYDDRYRVLGDGDVDIAVSATASPHVTITRDDLGALTRVPKIIVDLAVPRDVESSVSNLHGVTLLTIDDISGSSQRIPPESILVIDTIIAEHITKYRQWLSFKENKYCAAGDAA